MLILALLVGGGILAWQYRWIFFQRIEIPKNYKILPLSLKNPKILINFKEVKLFPEIINPSVHLLSISEDGNVFTGQVYGKVEYQEEPVWKFFFYRNGEITRLPSGNFAMSESGEVLAYVEEVAESRQQVVVQENGKKIFQSDTFKRIFDIAVSPRGEIITFEGEKEGKKAVYVWHRDKIYKLETPEDYYLLYPISEEQVLIKAGISEVNLWLFQNGNFIRLGESFYTIDDVCISNDKKVIVAMGSDKKKKPMLYLRKGEEETIKEVPYGEEYPFRSVITSKDGEEIIIKFTNVSPHKSYLLVYKNGNFYKKTKEMSSISSFGFFNEGNEEETLFYTLDSKWFPFRKIILEKKDQKTEIKIPGDYRLNLLTSAIFLSKSQQPLEIKGEDTKIIMPMQEKMYNLEFPEDTLIRFYHITPDKILARQDYDKIVVFSISHQEIKIPEVKILEEIKTPEEGVEDETAELAPSEVEGWKTYRNKEYGFEMEYPGDWEIVIREKKNIIGFRLIFPKPVHESYFYIGIMVKNNPEHLNIEDFYVQEYKRYCWQDAHGSCFFFHPTQPTKIIVSRMGAFKFEKIPDLTPLTIVVVLKGNLIFEIGKKEDLSYNDVYPQEKLQEIFNQMLSTFRFLE